MTFENYVPNNPFRIKTTYGHLLFMMLLGSFFLLSQTTATAQFVGADFYYTFDRGNMVEAMMLPNDVPNEGMEQPTSVVDPNMPVTYTVTLKLYYDCFQEDFHQSHPVTIHESIGNMQTAELDLKLDSVSVSESYLSVACNTTQKQCLKIATYSGKIELIKLAGGYDISWGNCCWDFLTSNLDNLSMQGVAMVLHIPDVVNHPNNSSPEFVEIPQVLTCPGTIMNINSMAIDRDGDKLSYKLIAPFTHEQTVNYGDNAYGELYPGQHSDTPLIVGRPPFKSTTYGEGYSSEKPLGKAIFSIDKETGSIDLQPTEPGSYLIGIGVSEYFNDILLGEAQRIFLLEVLSNPSDNISTKQ